ncbi:MAG: sulfotransferase domain-containing protein [Proteobacteria bacterium]|nr:sulfotransferase domain-containing protein [Pseudomonadota bacterium]
MRPARARGMRASVASVACAKDRLLEFACTALDRLLPALEDAQRTARYVKGRRAYRARPSDIFVASYPRSGNTVAQWMIYLMTHGRGSAAAAHVSELAPWFERQLATGELAAEDFERFDDPRVIKTHLPRAWLPDGARYVYVQRDGRDVAASYYHLYQAYLGFRGSFEEFFDRFLCGELQYGSWFDHVAEWRAHGDDPDVLIVSYEQLVKSRQACVERFETFLDCHPGEERRRSVLEQSDITAMKNRESFFDHATALLLERGVKPGSFIRNGKIGDGVLALSPRQRAAFELRQSSAQQPRTPRLALFLH